MDERKDYISWHTYFMAVAQLSAQRSKDPSTQVGACIVSKDNRILGVGYNGAPNGYPDAEFPWGKREGATLDTKYPYICHAELNAILNFRGNNRELENARIYTALFPCNNCAQLIIQSGIKEVVYLSDKYANVDIFIAGRKMLEKCGVKLRQLDVEDKHKLLTLDLSIK